jgi:hypothetical protein
VAKCVGEFIRDRRWSNTNIVIGVNSTSALAGSFELGDDDPRLRRTLLYDLERILPCAAEEIVADFSFAGNKVFAVALRIDVWLPIVIELEARGFRVQSISPVALMALQSYLDDADDDSTDVVLWQDDREIELFRFHDKSVSAWRHFHADERAVASQLAVESLTRFTPLRCELINTSEQYAQNGLECRERETGSVAEHALRTAELVLAGSRSPLIELRREELAAGDPSRPVRGSLHYLYAAAVLLLVAVTSVLWIRSIQYQRRTDELLRQQVTCFKEAFPQSPVPVAILSRLGSERTRLSGARSGNGDVEFPVSALHVLLEFLSALPADQKYRFRECRIEDGRIDLDVEVRSHNEANVLVSSFGKRGFSVTAPTTVQQGPQTVSSRIFAELRAAGRSREEL